MALITPILLGLLAAFLYKPLSNDLLKITEHGSARILLLTAHPDDEAMFFAPTLLALKDAPRAAVQAQTDAPEQTVFATDDEENASWSKLFSLCLSTGNADGLGDVRSKELTTSLDVLGLDEDKRWIVDNPDLQDNITVDWDPAAIADVLLPYVLRHQITTILTFDSYGISQHPNHKALPEGVKELWKVLPVTFPRPRLFTLITVPTSGKYTTLLGATLAKFDLYASKVLLYYENLINKGLENMDVIPEGSLTSKDPPVRLMPVFVSGYAGYLTAFKAMLAHRSQLVWFRWLYLAFSRYMWVNEWAEVSP